MLFGHVTAANPRRRPLRFAACLVAAYLFLEPAAGAAASPADHASVAAVAAAFDTGCPRSQPTTSRAAARGTLPDTGSGRSTTALLASAGMLLGGLLLRGAANRLRRRETM